MTRRLLLLLSVGFWAGCTNPSTTSTTAAAGAGATGGGGAGGEGVGAGGAHTGGAGGHGGSPDPSAAFAERLGDGVWWFQSEFSDADQAWVRFTREDGTNGGTLAALAIDGLSFPCGGPGSFGVSEGTKVSVTLDACGLTFFEVDFDPFDPLPAGVLDGFHVIVSQVTPMKVFKYPAAACDTAMTACSP